MQTVPRPEDLNRRILQLRLIAALSPSMLEALARPVSPRPARLPAAKPTTTRPLAEMRPTVTR